MTGTLFGPNRQSKKTSKQTVKKNYDHQRAEFLAALLKRTDNLRCSYSLTSWSEEFRKMRSIVTAKQVNAVLLWLSKNIGKGFVPKVYSARSFRQKFSQLEAAKRRHDDKNLDPMELRNLMLKVDDMVDGRARYCAERLLNWRWPQGATYAIPNAVQQSFNNLEPFWIALERVKPKRGLSPKMPKDTPLYDQHRWRVDLPDGITLDKNARSLASFIINHLAGDFVYNWFTELFHRVCDWPGWGGDVQAIDPRSEKFHRTMLSVAAARGDIGAWNRLWSHLKTNL